MHRLTGEFSVRVDFRNYAMNFLFSKKMLRLRGKGSDSEVLGVLVVNLEDYS